jgi:hypothetical protein
MTQKTERGKDIRSIANKIMLEPKWLRRLSHVPDDYLQKYNCKCIAVKHFGELQNTRLIIPAKNPD